MVQYQRPSGNVQTIHTIASFESTPVHKDCLCLSPSPDGQILCCVVACRNVKFFCWAYCEECSVLLSMVCVVSNSFNVSSYHGRQGKGEEKGICPHVSREGEMHDSEEESMATPR